jgi:hypothetical protein
LPTRLLTVLLLGGVSRAACTSTSPVRGPAPRLLRASCGESMLRACGPPPPSTSGIAWGLRWISRPCGLIAPGFESSDGAAAPSGGPAIESSNASRIASAPSATATAAGANDCPAAVAVEALGLGSPGPSRATTTQLLAPMASTRLCLSCSPTASCRRFIPRPHNSGWPSLATSKSLPLVVLAPFPTRGALVTPTRWTSSLLLILSAQLSPVC